MAYGTGTIYQRGRIWWIAYWQNGEQQKESSGSTDRGDAKALLARRMGEVAASRALGRNARALTVPDLLEMLADDYREREIASLVDMVGKIRWLKDFFRSVRANQFGTEHIKRMRRALLKLELEKPTINRYAATLRRAFNMAAKHDPPLVNRVPNFEMYEENPARTGFVTDSQYRQMLACLPEHLRGLLIFGFHLGMRRDALKALKRENVDWPAKIIRAEQVVGRKKVGRVLPIYGDMIPWLEMQMAAWSETPKCKYIFHHNGLRIGAFRKSWNTARKLANLPDLLFHDLRRSAVRNMERAGVPRSQAMAISGHKTESIYKRYAIVAESDITEAGGKVNRMIEAERQEQQAKAATERPM
jgi:integrase